MEGGGKVAEAKFLDSPKSTLEPTESLHCLGKFFDVEGGGGGALPTRSSRWRNWSWPG